MSKTSCIVARKKVAQLGRVVQLEHLERSGEMDNPDLAKQRGEQDDLEARDHFWSCSGRFIYRLHIQERKGKYLFLFRLKYIEINRSSHTTLGVLLESKINDNLNVQTIPSSSTLRKRYTWSGIDQPTFKQRPGSGTSGKMSGVEELSA